MKKQRSKSKTAEVQENTQRVGVKRDNVKRESKPVGQFQQFRTGKVTRNPFLNFLRDMRKNTKGMSPLEMSVKGAEIWRNMSKSQKEPYCLLARQVAKRKRRRRSRRRRGRRGRRHSYTDLSDDDRANDYTEARRRRRRRSRSGRKRSRSKRKRH